MFPFFLALYNGSQVSIVVLWATCFDINSQFLLGKLFKKAFTMEINEEKAQYFTYFVEKKIKWEVEKME